MTDPIPEPERGAAARFFSIRNLDGELPESFDEIGEAWTSFRDRLLEAGTLEELLDDEIRTWQARVGTGGDDHVRRVWAVFMGRLDAEEASIEVASEPIREHAIFDHRRSSVAASSTGNSPPVIAVPRIVAATEPPLRKRYRPSKQHRKASRRSRSS